MPKLIDLQKKSGLPLAFDVKAGKLKFLNNLPAVKPAARTLREMRDYLWDSKALSRRKNLYLMYRDIFLPRDEKLIKKNHLRYDITVMAPGLIGKEFIKTIGHYHPFKPKTKIRYPEVYEVLFGRALYLIQRTDYQYKKVLEVYLIEAGAGQKVITPPGFGHVMINLQNNWLIMADWTADNFQSIYEPYLRHQGAIHYIVKNKTGFKLAANQHYKNPPKIKVLKPKEKPEFGLMEKEPMYSAGTINISRLKFLTHPEKFIEQLTIAKCFKSKING